MFSKSKQPDPPKQFSWQKKKKDLSNFQFLNETAKLLIKPPGSLAGQQFRIQECHECNIYVHDSHDQCFIDLCTESVIVMGPCSSSTFIRNCKNCRFVVTCQQLRMRDCVNVEVMLFSQTQPVIESSINVRFSCHEYVYPELAGQMKAAKISYLNNKWTEIFDFTPDKARGKLNYSLNYGPQGLYVSNLKLLEKIIGQFEKKRGFKPENLKQIGEEDLAQMNLEVEEDETKLIPLTYTKGERKRTQECLILLLLPNQDAIYEAPVMQLVQSLQERVIDEHTFWLQETRNTDLTRDQCAQIGFAKAKLPEKVTVVAFHIQGGVTAQQQPLEMEIRPIMVEAKKKIQVSVIFDLAEVQDVADKLFREYNIDHTGHNIAQ